MEEKTNPCILPHAHRDGFNIEACWACGKIRLCHTQTDAETGSKPKKQPKPTVILWRAVNRSTHTKRQTKF
ncbi:MAG: hypothetical protein NWE92_11305 [Candidatus Bathyarchaeota archaeon]|nr:hypothetical protein [Candidatus Bathyarchaeota archaeon]